MKRMIPVAAALVAAIASPLAAHAQSVTILGEGNPASSGATRNTTGASPFTDTIRQEDPGARTIAAPAVPSNAGRTSGTEFGTNTGTTAGGGAGALDTSTGTSGTTGTIGPAGTRGTGAVGSGAGGNVSGGSAARGGR